MNSLDSIRFLANNFNYLQGLKTIPLGLALILVSYWDAFNHQAREISRFRWSHCWSR